MSGAGGAVGVVGVVGVVMPVRGFRAAKERLAGELAPERRAELARDLADVVLRAASPLRVAVVTGAPEVEEWARTHGAAVIADPGGLDAAARAGVAWCASWGACRAVVAHADLPHATNLAGVARDASRRVATIVPCHRDDGTNVLSLPVDVDFRFSYGPGSFRRHVAEARRLGLATRVVRRADLAFDVDVPSDLAATFVAPTRA